MTNRKLFLNQMLDIGGIASIHNFYSPEALTYKGSLLQADKYFKEWLKIGIIREVPFDQRIRNKRREVFYCLTPKGADSIGRKSEYKYKDPKALNNALHESAKFDTALAFLRNYPDHIINIDYTKSYSGLRPDLVVTMSDMNDNKKIFLVEIERKKTVDRVVNEKIGRYEHTIAPLIKNGALPKNTQILFLYSNFYWNAYLRPQEFSQYGKMLSFQYAQLRHLVKKVSYLPEYYKFAIFPDFHRIHQNVWLNSHGKKSYI